MNTKSENVVETTKLRQVEGIELLHALQNKEVEIDFNICGVTLTQFITKLSVIEEDYQILLDDFIEESNYISIKKEKVLEIYEDLYDDRQIVISLINNSTITLTLI